MLRRNLISASGQVVERASRGNTIVNVTSSCILTSGRIYARGARSHLLVWMLLIVTVSIISPLASFPHTVIANALAYFCFETVRSEGGAECRKIQQEVSPSDSATDVPASGATANGGAGGSTNTSASNSPPSGMKPDPDGSWSMVNGGVMM